MRVTITGGNGDLGGALVHSHPLIHSLRCIDLKLTGQTQADIEYRQADVCDLPSLTDAMRGCDAVIHLAAICIPHIAPAETVFRVNALGANNVSLVCEALSIGHIVFASSICYYGYIFRKDFATPLYLPVVEYTLPQVEDSYSLSKLVGENIMRAFVQRSGGSVASLRFTYLMRHGAAGSTTLPPRMSDFPMDQSTAKSWWTYVDLDDAASAVWLALDYIAKLKGRHEAFNIGADDTHTTTPTSELIAAFFPQTTTHYNDPLKREPHVTLYSNRKARSVLGFSPSAPKWRTRLGL